MFGGSKCARPGIYANNLDLDAGRSVKEIPFLPLSTAVVNAVTTANCLKKNKEEDP